MKIRRILVPTDFSTYSHDALEYAIELAKPFKAELVALFVVEPAQYSMASMYGAAPQVLADLLDEQTRTGRAQLSGLQQRLQKRRIKLRTLLRSGAPYEAIVEAAKRLKADLMGRMLSFLAVTKCFPSSVEQCTLCRHGGKKENV